MLVINRLGCSYFLYTQKFPFEKLFFLPGSNYFKNPPPQKINWFLIIILQNCVVDNEPYFLKHWYHIQRFFSKFWLFLSWWTIVRGKKSFSRIAAINYFVTTVKYKFLSWTNVSIVRSGFHFADLWLIIHPMDLVAKLKSLPSVQIRSQTREEMVKYSIM